MCINYCKFAQSDLCIKIGGIIFTTVTLRQHSSVEFRMIIQLGNYKLPGYNQCRSKRFIMGSAKYVSETTSMAV